MHLFVQKQSLGTKQCTHTFKQDYFQRYRARINPVSGPGKL
jgi:hypothetical protein